MLSQHWNSEITIIRRRDDSEQRQTLKGTVDSKLIFLPMETDLEVDDLVEDPLPGGKIRTLRITEVNYLRSPFGGRTDLDHIEAKFVPANARPNPTVRAVTLPALHPEISRVAAVLYDDGHCSKAVFEAMRAVEHRVQKQTGRSESGQLLMSLAFGATGILDVRTVADRAGDDEQEGFKLLFMGAMSGVRNPRGHGPVAEDQPKEALEYLAFASLLMRRLDVAAARQAPRANQ